jgi:Skp family chaperone for outer membrane proteins
MNGVVAGWILSVALASPLLALAQTSVPSSPGPIPLPVIGVVDVDQIQQESLAAKAVRAQAVKYRQEFQQQDNAEEAALRATKQVIEQDSKTLPPQELADKARAFDASVADYQRKELARRRAFEKSFNLAMGKVQQAMYDATRQVAMSHGANVILPRGQVLLFDDKMNLTKEIIVLMDKALPGADFPPPQIDLEPLAPTSANLPVAKKKN